MKISHQIRTALKAQPREHLKLWVGQLFCPQATARWLAFVEGHALLLPYVARFPRLVTRIYRPYGFRPLSCGQRVDLMIAHYQWLERLGIKALLSQSVETGRQLAEVETKSGEKTTLHLHAIHDGHREGEMSLQLHWGEHFLFTLNFVLVDHADGCARACCCCKQHANWPTVVVVRECCWCQTSNAWRLTRSAVSRSRPTTKAFGKTWGPSNKPMVFSASAPKWCCRKTSRMWPPANELKPNARPR